MAHIFAKTQGGSYCNTSNNLLFSSKWLSGYIQTFQLPIVLGSRESVLEIKAVDLEKQLSYSYKREDRAVVQQAVVRLKMLTQELETEKAKLNKIGMDHYFAHAASI